MIPCVAEEGVDGFVPVQVESARYCIFLTGAGAPQLLPELAVPHGYQPHKGDILAGRQGLYRVTGYVSYQYPEHPMVVSISVLPLADSGQTVK